MAFQNMFDNGQSQTRPAFFSAAAFINAIKPFKNTINMFGRNSFSEIPDANGDIFFTNGKTDNNLTAIKRVLNGIGDQIGHYLGNALPVCEGHNLLNGAIDAQLDIFSV